MNSINDCFEYGLLAINTASASRFTAIRHYSLGTVNTFKAFLYSGFEGFIYKKTKFSYYLASYFNNFGSLVFD